MMIGRLEPDNKWNWGMRIGDNFMTHFRKNPFNRLFEIWFFKITDKNFDRTQSFNIKTQAKGFWYKKEFFSKWNIVVKVKTIRFIYSIKFIKDK